MEDRAILKVGMIGSVVAAICCFTPLLVVLLGAVGLTAWLGWLDYVLLPALVLSVAITAYGFYLRKRKTAACPISSDNVILEDNHD